MQKKFVKFLECLHLVRPLSIAMLGDLMERTSLAEALDKLNSDVAAQNAAGLDALKSWLQVGPRQLLWLPPK